MADLLIIMSVDLSCICFVKQYSMANLTNGSKALHSRSKLNYTAKMI